MAYITGWIKNLIFLILFTTFLMMFLPGNKMRKYVKVVLGFFIITIFISPISSIFNQNFDEIVQIIPEKIVANDMDLIKRQGEELKNSNKNILNEYYSEKVEKQIKKVVELEFPEWQNNIQVKIDNSYQIKQIQIMLQQDLIRDIEINPVEYEEFSEDDQIQNQEQSQWEQKLIILKNKISNMLQVPLNIINIEIRGERDGDF